MAYNERTVTGDLEALVNHIHAVITGGSVTASLEARSDRQVGEARMVVLAFERYSAMGGNRLGLPFSLLALGQEIAVTAVATGGSQAMFFKINTFGEQAFLDHADGAISAFASPG